MRNIFFVSVLRTKGISMLSKVIDLNAFILLSSFASSYLFFLESANHLKWFVLKQKNQKFKTWIFCLVFLIFY